MKPAIFLDRDGTLIKDKGVIKSISQIEFYPYTFNCLRELQQKYLLFIITNQSGISKGLVLKKQVDKVNLYVKDVLTFNGVHISDVYCCPHQKSDNCSCRKPQTFFMEKAQKEFNVDMKKSYVIGDHPSDVKLAINSCSNGIYLLTGHGRKHYKELSDSLLNKIVVNRNLEFATKQIIKSNKFSE